jgi:acyl-CoA thioester hydrolase
VTRRLERPLVPQELRFRTLVHTRWVDEDNQGVLNNAVYLTLLEEARHAYFGSLGLMDGAHFPFVLAQCNAWFVRPGRGGVDATVELATVQIGTSSFVQVYRVGERRGDASSETWLEAEALLVGWDNRTRTKAALTASFVERVRAFEAHGT